MREIDVAMKAEEGRGQINRLAGEQRLKVEEEEEEEEEMTNLKA